MEPVSEFLVAYLTAVDERLLIDLDLFDEMMIDPVERRRFSASALLGGSIAPAALRLEWPDRTYMGALELRLDEYQVLRAK